MHLNVGARSCIELLGLGHASNCWCLAVHLHAAGGGPQVRPPRGQLPGTPSRGCAVSGIRVFKQHDNRSWSDHLEKLVGTWGLAQQGNEDDKQRFV